MFEVRYLMKSGASIYVPTSLADANTIAEKFAEYLRDAGSSVKDFQTARGSDGSFRVIVLSEIAAISCVHQSDVDSDVE